MPSLVSPHTLQTAVVLEEFRLLYVPAPKAASTSILWALARAAGIDREELQRSVKLEVTRALTVHDLGIWGDEHRLKGRSHAERDEILRTGDWFRFTVVRDPTRRLWSAWVSKILVRDPRFVSTFGDEAWFPPPPTSSFQVAERFRCFVRTLPDRPRDWHDPHWSSQAELVSAKVVPFDLVGRTEQLDDTFARLGERFRGHEGAPMSASRENEALLPFAAELFDPETLEASDAVTASDRAAFGYKRLDVSGDEPPAGWHATVTASLGAIRAVIERNQRVADLKRMLDERSSEQRLLRVGT